MKRNLSTLAVGFLTAAVGSLAVAQTTSTTTDHPTPIGTSQQTADQANRKAIQEGGTATVVRTGPSAADHLKKATSAAGDKAASATKSVNAKTKAATTDDGTAVTSTTSPKP